MKTKIKHILDYCMNEKDYYDKICDIEKDDNDYTCYVRGKISSLENVINAISLLNNNKREDWKKFGFVDKI